MLVKGRQFFQSSVVVMEIRNITAVGDFGCKLDLPTLYEKLPHVIEKKRRYSRFNLRPPLQELDARYKPAGSATNPKSRFPGLTLRITKPVKASVHVFASGKAVCLGTKSIIELKKAGLKFAQILISNGYSVRFPEFEIKNFVSSASVRSNIDLIKFQETIGGFYEPELFPGLQYSIKKKTVTFFHTGKIVVTGLKREEEIKEIYEEILTLVKPCLK